MVDPHGICCQLWGAFSRLSDRLGSTNVMFVFTLHIHIDALRYLPLFLLLLEASWLHHEFLQLHCTYFNARRAMEIIKTSYLALQCVKWTLSHQQMQHKASSDSEVRADRTQNINVHGLAYESKYLVFIYMCHLGNSCYYLVQILLSSRLLSNNLKIKIYKTIILPVVLYGYLLSYIKGRIMAKGTWKQDSETNIWTQKGWEWGVEKAPQWGTL